MELRGNGSRMLQWAPVPVSGPQENKLKLLPPVAAAAYSLSTAAITRS